MKKPRIVTIPEDNKLTQAEYKDLSEHARKSALFYATSRGRSAGEIREKLIAKGYVDNDVFIVNKDDRNEVIGSSDIISETIEHLEDCLLLDDEELAQNISDNYQNKGKGEREIKRRMRDRKIDQSLIDKTLESITEEDNLEAVTYAAELYTSKSSYTREENPYKQKQKLFAHLSRRGFDTGTIKDYMELENER